MTRSVAEEMTCKDSRLIEAYLDGELDPSSLVEVEAHLKGAANGDGACVLCRERLALGRATRQSLKRVVRTATTEMGGREALRTRALTAMMAQQHLDSLAMRAEAAASIPDGLDHMRK